MFVIIVLRIIAPWLQRNAVSAGRSFPRVLSIGQGIPYAIGISPGALIVSYSFAPILPSLMLKRLNSCKDNLP
jgi:hypothetical protein